MIRLHHLLVSLTCLLATTALPLSAAVYSNTLGVIRLELTGGGNFNLVSSPFIPAALITSSVVSINGNEVELGAAVASIELGATHYLDVLEGDGVGMMSNITGQIGATVTLVDDLSSYLASGHLIAIRPIPTLDSIFGADNRFGFAENTDGLGAGADEIWILNPNTGVTQRYFFANIPSLSIKGWYSTAGTPSGGTQIYPESGVAIRVRGPDVVVTFVGEVKSVPGVSAVFQNYNLLSIYNPLSGVPAVENDRLLTLGNSGLFTGDPLTGVKPSLNGLPDDADLVVTLNPSTGVTKQYYYVNLPGFEGWYEKDIFPPVLSNDLAMESGTAFYLLRRDNHPFNWSQPVNHLP
jgi:hypothetical protein